MSVTLTIPVMLLAGVGKFSNLSVTTCGKGYRMALISPGFETFFTVPFDILPNEPNKLVLRGVPERVVESQSMTIAVHVTDAFENTVGADRDMIVTASLVCPDDTPNAALLGGEGGGGGGLSVKTLNGVALFTGLRIDNNAAEGSPASSFQLKFSTAEPSGSPIESLTGLLEVLPRGGKTLHVLNSPTGEVTVGSLMSFTCQIMGSNDHPDGTDNSTEVTASVMRLETIQDPKGKSVDDVKCLMGGKKVKARNGIASFTDLKVSTIGEGYVMVFQAVGLPSAAAPPLDIIAQSPSKLIVIEEPPVCGTEEEKQRVVVQVKDPLGQNCPLAANKRSEMVILAELRLKGEPPNTALGDPLVGIKTVTTVNGIAVFNDLMVKKKGEGYTLTFREFTTGESDVMVAETVPFDIIMVSRPCLKIVGEPENKYVVNEPLWLTIHVMDLTGEVDEHDNDTEVECMLVPELKLGSPSKILEPLGSWKAKAKQGVVTFLDMKLRTATSSCQLMFAAKGLTSVTSNTFKIIPQSPTEIQVWNSPTATQSSNQPVKVSVQVLDSYGNRCKQVSTRVKATAIVTIGVMQTKEEEIPIIGGDKYSHSGVAEFKNLCFKGPVQQVRLRFSAEVRKVDPETGLAIGDEMVTLTTETGPFEVIADSSTGTHVMCDIEAPDEGVGGLLEISDSPNTKFRCIYGLDAAVIQLQTVFSTMICAKSGESGQFCYANVPVSYRVKTKSPNPGRVLRYRKILDCPTLEDGKWYTFTTGHNKLLYIQNGEGDEGASVFADGPPLPWDTKMSAAAHFKVVHVDGPNLIELHTIYGTACYTVGATRGTILLADRKIGKWPVFEKNKYFSCTYRMDGSVMLKSSQNGMLVARGHEDGAVCHADGKPGTLQGKDLLSESMNWRTFSFNPVHATTKLEEDCLYTFQTTHGSLLYAPTPTQGQEVHLLCDYTPYTGPDHLRPRTGIIPPSWTHFKVRYLEGPGKVELITAHGTVCHVTSSSMGASVRCDSIDKPWIVDAEQRSLRCIYGDEGLFGDDGTVQFCSSFTKILYAPGAVKGSTLSADGKIGEWRAGNDRKVLTFAKVEAVAEHGDGGDTINRGVSTRTTERARMSLSRHIQDQIDALERREQRLALELERWATSKVVRLEVQMANLAANLSLSRLAIFRAVTIYRLDDWSCPSLVEGLITDLDAAMQQPCPQRACTEASLKPYYQELLTIDVDRHGTVPYLKFAGNAESDGNLRFKNEMREVSATKDGFSAAIGVPRVLWTDEGVMRWEYEITRSSEMDIYIGVALESCKPKNMVDVMEKPKDTQMISGGVISHGANVGETLQTTCWLFRCKDGRSYRYVQPSESRGYMIGGEEYGSSTWEAGDRVGIELTLARLCQIRFLKNGLPAGPSASPAFAGVIGTEALCPITILCNKDDTIQLLPFLDRPSS